MSAADIAATYGAGVGGLAFVIAFAVMFWKAGKLADSRRAVAEAAAPAMAAREAMDAATEYIERALADLEAGVKDVQAMWEEANPIERRGL